MTSVVAAVFARGGSKGVPGKNLRRLGGETLVARAVRCAAAVPGVQRVLVSTDDVGIADEARAANAEVPFMRPPELATDTAPERAAWKHLVTHVRRANGPDACDVLLSVPATSPFRAVADVSACLKALLDDPKADTAVTLTPSPTNPYFNMVRRAADGSLQLAAKPDAPIQRRQDAPPVYNLTTVAYAVRSDHLLKTDSLFGGRVVGAVVPAERALDIDTELDWAFAEFLYARGAPNGRP